jgi:phosphoglucosamine mutase
MGGRVLLTGPLPTPAVAHLTVSMRADAGVVISASHNPYADNGIKIFGADGFKLPDLAEAEIERLIGDPSPLGPRKTGPGIGRAEKLEDARGRYIAFAKSTFPRDLSLDGLRLVVDAAHGAAYRVAPAVFQELGARVWALGVKPNGTNINRESGALHPENLRAEVVRRGAQIGVALDGDADRVIVVDEKGQVVDGDAVMAMCALRMIEAGELRHQTVVATVMSNLGLERMLAARGARLLRTPVGDRYVVEAMRQGGYNLGGEQSGHLIFLDHVSTGDGVVAALQVLALMLRSSRPLSELAHGVMERVPQVLENVTLPTRRPLDEMVRLQRLSDEVAGALGGDGRLLVRWSGTEPKLRIMLEGPDEDRIRAWARELAQAARQDVPEPAGR